MFPDGDKNSPPAAVCMGTSVAPEAVGTAVAGDGLADDVAADVATDVTALEAAPTVEDAVRVHAESASPRQKPSAEMPTILAVRMKRREFIVAHLMSHTEDVKSAPLSGHATAQAAGACPRCDRSAGK
jgi:hypothetical protein